MHDWHFLDRAKSPWRRAAVALAMALGMVGVHAHKASDAYLFLQPATAQAEPELRVDIALRDLDSVLSIDANGDGSLTWGEIKAARQAIERFQLAGIGLGACTLQVRQFGLEQRSDGAYAATTFAASCPPSQRVDAAAIRYTLFANVDPTHRAIAREQPRDGGTPILRLIDPRQAPAPVALAVVTTQPPADPTVTVHSPIAESAPPPSAATVDHAVPQSFVLEGMGHILGGYDHVLFLLCLLLPAVMRRTRTSTGHQWQPVPSLRDALLPIAGIVTMFTLAHSITLALAAFKLVRIPPSVIEPAIAITIIVTALDNLRPVFRLPRAAVTFLFGLIHGFGFADVLAELDLPSGQFALALFQFNLGLELGQLAIVAGVVTLLFLLRERQGYPRWAIQAGSMTAMLMGAWWLAERVGMFQVLA